MATTITKVVKEDGSGDYTTVLAWEAAEQKNLVAADEIARCQIEGPWTASESARVNIAGWTADATRYVEIEAIGAARHTGKWTNTAHSIKVTNTHAWLVGELSTKLIGLQGERTQTVSVVAGTYSLGVGSTGSECRECIGVLNSNNAVAQGCAFEQVLAVVSSQPHFRNCLAYETGSLGTVSQGFRFNLAGSGTKHADSCTAVGFLTNAFLVSSTQVLQNCIGTGSGGNDFSAAISASSNNNAAGDASLSGGTGNRINQTFTFVDAPSFDFHLAEGDVGARTFGIDLSAFFTIDIDGDTRVAPWDIGADQFGAAPPSGGGGILDVTEITDITGVLG